MRPVEDLITWHRDVEFDERPVLLHAFSGFVDAGNGVRIAADHLLSSLDHTLVATFDSDELIDYRARRPRMSFVVDHFASVELDQIDLHEVTDTAGTRFLLLAGPEPDYQWLRFIGAVKQVTERFDVRLAVGMSAIPWPTPHTRPIGVTVHGSQPELVAGPVAPIGEVEVPGHVGAMLELQLGQDGVPSMGVTAQVPHYLVQFAYPRSATTLLAGVSAATGLSLPADELEPAARQADADIAAQVAGNEEFGTVVAALEQQYDQQISAPGRAIEGGLAGQSLPSAEELAAQVEQFLSELPGLDDPQV
jgi:proteasome assembly chaperone (PAC2) family protein